MIEIHIPLSRYRLLKDCLRRVCGVYSCWSRGQCLYVGKSINLFSRISQHWRYSRTGAQGWVLHGMSGYGDEGEMPVAPWDSDLRIWTVDAVGLDELEVDLIKEFKPLFNTLHISSRKLSRRSWAEFPFDPSKELELT